MKKTKPTKSLRPINVPQFSRANSLEMFPNKLVKQGARGLLLHTLLYFIIFIIFFSIASILVPEIGLSLNISLLTAFTLSLVVTWYIHSMAEEEKKAKTNSNPKNPVKTGNRPKK